MDARSIKEKAKQKVLKAKDRAKTIVSKQKREPLYEPPEYTGNPEIDSQAELDQVQKAFRQRIKDENKRFEQATDSEYWFSVCFQTREQKEAFLKAVDWIEQGDKYLDGQFVADRLGVELPKANNKYLADGKIDKDYAKLSF